MTPTHPTAWHPSRLHPTRWLAVLLGSQPWLPSFAPTIVRLDLLVRRLTAGRLSLLSFAGLPELFLTVLGRKTGLPRTTPLLCVPRDGHWLVAGSNWGQPRPPMWVGNLVSAGEGTVEFRGDSTPVTARLLTGAERQSAWEALLEVWPSYATYAARTDREIPVFALTPH